jgi:prolyl-tRNA synthetase
MQMIEIYRKVLEEYLQFGWWWAKTAKRKIAERNARHTIEALMHDGQALQSGTSIISGIILRRRLRLISSEETLPNNMLSSHIMGSVNRLSVDYHVHGDDTG